MSATPAVAPSVPSSAVVTLPAAVTSLAALNRSPSVVAGLGDGSVAVWNGADATPLVLKPHAASVLAVGSNPAGQEAWSVASDGSLARTSVAPGSQPALLRVDLGSDPVRAAVFSSDGSRLTCGGEFGELRVFDTASGRLLHRLRGHRTELQDLAARPGSPLVASASAESDLRIWDTSSGRAVAALDGELSLFTLAFSPRDGTLASGGVDRRLTLRDPVTFQRVSELVLPAPKMVAAAAWSADGRRIGVGDIDDATLSKGGIQVIDAASRELLATLDTGGSPPGRLVFAGGAGRVIAAIGRDLRAWNLSAH